MSEINTPTVASAVEAIDALPIVPIGDADVSEEELPPLTLDEAVQEIEDQSRLRPGVVLHSLVEGIIAAASVAVAAEQSLTASYKAAAEAVARAFASVLHPDGRPDWEGATRMSETVLSFSLDKVLNSSYELKGKRKQVRAAIMAHVDRTYRLIMIREYVASMTEMDGETPLFPDGPDDTSGLFLGHVRRQYKLAGLKVPAQYQTPEDKQNAGDNGSGPGNATNHVTRLRNGIESSKNVTMRLAVNTALRILSTIVERIVTGQTQYGSEADKQYASDTLYRCAQVAKYGALAVQSKTNEQDAEKVMAALWSDEDDSFESPDNEQ